MNPCFIYKLLSIYIAAWFLINPVHSTDPDGNPESKPNSGGGSPTSETKSPVTYIDLDFTKTQSTNQYEYKKEDNVETFTAKEGYAIKSYSEGTDVKWTSDGTKHYKEVKKTKQADGTYKYQAARYNPTGQSQSKASTVQTQASTPKSEIKIITQVGDDTSKTKENDATQYDLKQADDLLDYKFKDNVKCVEVKYDKKEVWKYDSSKVNEHPESVLFNTTKNTVLVTFKSTISICNLESEQWKTTFTGKPEPVELDIKSKKNTDHWDYSKTDKVGTYTAKDRKFFNSVAQSSGGCCGSNCCSSNCCKSGCCGSSCCGNSAQDIWKTEDVSEYATKVVVKGIGSSTKLVAIFLLNGTTKTFNRPGNDKPWVDGGIINKLIDETLNPVIVVVGNKKSNENCNYTCHGDKRIYTPKEGCAFKIIRFAAPSLNEPVEKVWDATGPDKYVTKIELEGNVTKYEITLYIVSGVTKKFTRTGRKWNEQPKTTATADTTPVSGTIS